MSDVTQSRLKGPVSRMAPAQVHAHDAAWAQHNHRCLYLLQQVFYFCLNPCFWTRLAERIHNAEQFLQLIGHGSRKAGSRMRSHRYRREIVLDKSFFVNLLLLTLQNGKTQGNGCSTSLQDRFKAFQHEMHRARRTEKQAALSSDEPRSAEYCDALRTDFVQRITSYIGTVSCLRAIRLARSWTERFLCSHMPRSTMSQTLQSMHPPSSLTGKCTAKDAALAALLAPAFAQLRFDSTITAGLARTIWFSTPQVEPELHVRHLAA